MIPPLQPPLPEPLLRLGLGLLAPFLRRGPVDRFPRPGHHLIGELEVQHLHPLDLVAQAAGLLELEV